MTPFQILLVITTVAVALVAGLLYGYSCSVNRGLGKLDNREYLNAMQSINRAIINPAFMLSFLGALLLLPVTACLSFQKMSQDGFAIVLMAAILYLAGVFAVTMVGNVPLNNQLEKFDLTIASGQKVAECRIMFEKSWNRLHNVRTFTSIVVLVLMVIACVCYKNGIVITRK